MKKIVSAFVFVCFALIATAQVGDTTSTKTVKKLTKFPKDRIAIDLNGTNWYHKIPDFKSKWYGRGISAYFYYDFRIKKSRFSIAPGIGVSHSNIYNNMELIDSGGVAQFTKISDYSTDKYKVNKVSLTYIDIPIEFRIRSNKDRLDNFWKFAVGFKAGIRVDAFTKQKTTNPNKTVILRPYPDFNLFHAGPTFRIGYSSFNITGYWGILGVFKSGKGPEAYPFSLGISFNGL
jgi:hypothetical protein